MKCDVQTLTNEKVGSIDLNPAVFGVSMRKDILARVVNWQLAKRRAGTHATKTISQISGTTRKPYKQKGTGNARQGSLRSPQFRGGATIFGPLPRDHAHDLPKKVRALGLRVALSSKYSSGKIIVLSDFELGSNKTKDMREKLSVMGLKNALFIDGASVNSIFKQAINNIPNINVLPQIGANVYDILRHDRVVLTQEAVKLLEERLV